MSDRTLDLAYSREFVRRLLEDPKLLDFWTKQSVERILHPNVRTIYLQYIANYIRFNKDKKRTIEHLQQALADDEDSLSEFQAIVDSPAIRWDDIAQRVSEVLTAVKFEEFLAQYQAGKRRIHPSVLELVSQISKKSRGNRTGRSIFDPNRDSTGVERLPIGIDDLDITLGGGLPEGCFGVVLGATGVGKSFMLVQIAATAAKYGKRVAVATLENSRDNWLDRLLANLTGIPIAELEVSASTRKEATKRVMDLGLNEIIVEEFTQGVTEAHEIVEWAEEHEASVLVVDYGDLLGYPNGIKSSYEGMRHVYSGLMSFCKTPAEERRPDRWVWTAAQARRRTKDSKGHLRNDDMADSMHKARMVDLIIGVNPVVTDVLDGSSRVEFNIVKARHAPNGHVFGPYITNFNVGRIAECLAEDFDAEQFLQ